MLKSNLIKLNFTLIIVGLIGLLASIIILQGQNEIVASFAIGLFSAMIGSALFLLMRAR